MKNVLMYVKRFNGTKLLERLRNKRMVYVGDSLNRGQWVSIVCMASSVIKNPKLMHMHNNGSNLISFKSLVSTPKKSTRKLEVHLYIIPYCKIIYQENLKYVEKLKPIVSIISSDIYVERKVYKWITK